MKAGIKTKVLAGFILGLLAIGLIGYQVHYQMTHLASSLYNNQPQNNLVTYQKILSTLSDAESSVRTFSITNNSNDLEAFHSSKEKLENYIEGIDKQPENDGLVTLNNLIYSKILTMEEIIEMRQSNPSENVLQEALNKIDKIKENSSGTLDQQHEEKITTTELQKLSIPEEKEKKEIDSPRKENKKQIKKEEKNFFQKLFSRKKTEKEPAKKEESQQNIENSNSETTDTSVTSDPEEQSRVATNIETKAKSDRTIRKKEETAQIEDSLERLQRKKKLEANVWQDKMISLIEDDNAIMKRIRIEMAQLEEKERQNQDIFISAAAQSKDKIVNNTTAVGIAAFTLILILSLVVVQDFDKLKKNRLSLLTEKEKANRHARVKEDFLANMSHEIRTPMNAIIGYTELLEKTTLADEQKDYLNTIQKSSKHLMVILNDILDYSKLESGKLKINKEPFNPLKSINQVVKTMEPDAQKKGIALQTNISSTVKKNLLGDAVRFQQILFNLVSNAIKFTDKGVVTIDLSATDGENEHLLELKVKDTGTGISKLSLEKIFKNFEQAESGRNRKYGGTGLGLAIVSRLVKLHHGTVEVFSEEGKGSEFVISLPYTVSKIKTVNQKPQTKKAEDFDFSIFNILAVDDQEYNLELVKIILEKWGAKINIVTSASKALEQLRSGHEYNLVLMDIQMPEMTGIEATEIIRKSQKALPIIALTAASTKEETDKCLKAGMNDFLLKPFKQKELKAILKEYAPDNRPKGNSSFTYSLNNLKKLSNGKKAFVVDMLEVFVKNIITDCDELKKHVAAENMYAIHRTAHKMLAPCLHLEMMQLVEIIGKIEEKSADEDNIMKISRLTEDADNLVREAVKRTKNDIKKLNQLHSL